MRILLATLLGATIVCAAHGRAAGMDTEIVSEGEVDGKFLFRVNGVKVMATEGDLIDGCTVTRRGLDCKGVQAAPLPGSGGLAAEIQRLGQEKERCENELARAEQGCHERYQANIRDFTEALKKKNYELSEKSKEIESLKADLARGDRVISALRDEGGASPPKAAPKTAHTPAPPPASPAATPDKNVLGILASLEDPAPKDSGKKAPAPGKAGKTPGSAKPAPAASPAPSGPSEARFVAIRLNWSNLRAAPGVQSPIVSQGLTGDIFPVVAKSKDGWYQVRLDDGGSGWVAEDIVTAVTPPTQPVSSVNTAAMARAGHLRAAANPRSPSVGVVPAGEALMLIEQTRNWLKVSRPGGGEGWLHRSMVRPGGE